MAYRSFTEVPEALRQDLADWLLAVADNKSVLGLRYAEWCTGAPELEADVAVSAMAQYELGHARLLRGALNDLPEDPRDESRDTDAAAWRSLAALDRPARSWVDVVVLNALVDRLLTINLEAAAGGGLRPLAQRLRKAVAEEQYHSLHAEAWAQRLFEGPDELADRARASVRDVWPECVAWFGPADDNALDRLAEAGLIAAGAAALRGRYLEAVVSMLQGHVELPVRRDGNGWEAAEEPDWEGWSEVSRRRGVPDFDSESFAMLTGAHARAMGVQD